MPETFKEHFRLMADLQILAFQMDVTRRFDLHAGREQSRRTYNEIGIPEEHHGLTHHAGDPIKIAKMIQIDNYMAERFAYYLDKIKSVQEGGQVHAGQFHDPLGQRQWRRCPPRSRGLPHRARGQRQRHAEPRPLHPVSGRHAGLQSVAAR